MSLLYAQRNTANTDQFAVKTNLNENAKGTKMIEGKKKRKIKQSEILRKKKEGKKGQTWIHPIRDKWITGWR